MTIYNSYESIYKPLTDIDTHMSRMTHTCQCEMSNLKDFFFCL